MWVTYGRTESGDGLPVLFWGDKEPTAQQIDEAYYGLLPEEYDEVGFVSWTKDEALDFRS